MEYLTLQDLPRHHYNPLPPRSMTSSQSSERPLGSVAAAVSQDHSSTISSESSPSSPSFTPPASSPSLASPLLARSRAVRRLEILKRSKRLQDAVTSEQNLLALLEQYVELSTYLSTLLEKGSEADPSPSPSPSPSRSRSPSYSCDSCGGATQCHPGSSRTSLTNEKKNHHMRSSPPIQPGEQNFPAKLPSFSEFLNTTRASTPPRTPSQRNGSSDNSPQPKPHFEEVAWSESKRRRVDSHTDTFPRSSASVDHGPGASRRLSSFAEVAGQAYETPRSAHYDGSQSALPLHHHRPSVSYQPPVHPAAPQNASFRPRPAPPVSQGITNYAPQPRRQSIVPPNACPPPPAQHGAVYEHRGSYYQEHQPTPNSYSYDRPHESYYSQSAYAGPAYEHSYGDIRFHQHVGLDQNAFNRKRRGNLPKEATNVLKDWFAINRASPYPTEDQKLALCNQTGLSLNQVSNWFINARRRAPQKEQREREANAEA